MIYLPTLSPLARHALASIILMTMETRLVRQDRLKVTDALADVHDYMRNEYSDFTISHRPNGAMFDTFPLLKKFYASVSADFADSTAHDYEIGLELVDFMDLQFYNEAMAVMELVRELAESSTFFTNGFNSWAVRMLPECTAYFDDNYKEYAYSITKMEIFNGS